MIPRRRRKPRVPGGREGFTIVELLFASLVLSVGFMAMIRLQYTAVKANSRAGNVSEATMLAEQRLETIKMTPYASVTSAAFPDEAYGAVAGYPKVKRATVIQSNTPGADRKTVTVSTTFRDFGGVERTVSISTIVRDS